MIDNIIFTSKNIAYTYGGEIFIDAIPTQTFGSMLKTTDGGSTWKQLSHPFGYILKAVFKDNNNGYTFTFNGDMYKTTDGGLT